jgi:hypothetical protein
MLLQLGSDKYLDNVFLHALLSPEFIIFSVLIWFSSGKRKGKWNQKWERMLFFPVKPCCCYKLPDERFRSFPSFQTVFLSSFPPFSFSLFFLRKTFVPNGPWKFLYELTQILKSQAIKKHLMKNLKSYSMKLKTTPLDLAQTPILRFHFPKHQNS